MKLIITILSLLVSIAPAYSKVLDIQPKDTFYLGTLSEYLKKPIGKVSFTATKDACPVINPVTGERYTGQCLKGLNTVQIGQTHKLEHFPYR